MDVAATQQDLARPHANHTAPRKQPLQKCGCGAIASRIKKRHNDTAVGRVKIDIASRQPLPSAARRTPQTALYAARLPRSHRQRPWHWEFVHLKATSARVACVMQTLPGVS